MASTKGYRNSKKVDEVREVCQNKPEAEISKVLEVFDNDVAKTINAFMTDGGKQALSKWASLKKNERISNKTDQADNVSAKSQRQNNNKKNTKPTTNGGTNNNSNINDLVSSIINQSINTTVPGTPNEPGPKDIGLVENGSLSSQVKQQQIILNSLNNLITNGHSKTFSALKVTVVGQEPEKQQHTKPALPTKSCSITSSPSSMSTASVSSDFITTHAPPANMSFHTLNNNLNMSYTNPNNTRASLDKYQKDLHRQSIHLAKISSQFQDDLNKAQIDCNQTFMFLRNILDERQQQLHAQLNSVGRQGNQILTERQHKASQLRTLVDNATHLNDTDTMELKADIKHFVSERQVDEEFLKLKLFQQDSSNLREAISNFARIPQLDQIKYASERPPTEQVMNNNFFKPKEPVANGVQHKTVNHQARTEKPISNGIRNSVKITEVNGHSDEQDSDGGFIEIKKPQRNKNKQHQPQNGTHTNNAPIQAASKVPLNVDTSSSKTNSVPITNGSGTSTTNGVSKKKKQPKKKMPEVPIAKANMNSFSLIANGHIN
jgi:hypothetical protein